MTPLPADAAGWLFANIEIGISDFEFRISIFDLVK